MKNKKNLKSMGTMIDDFSNVKNSKLNNCVIKNASSLIDTEVGINTIIEFNCVLDNCKVGKNCKISGNCFLKNCVIEDNCTINHGCVIENSFIDSNVIILSSYIQDSKICEKCIIGPFSRFRENVIIGQGVKIGNFVEIKNSNIGDFTKISHLAYVGDASVGKNCNIGCGVVFVNYNGKEKFKTVVEDNCFIGCNCNLIAPIKIERNSYICAGTNVTKNVNEFDFVIGRVKQENLKGKAKLYLKEIIND